MCDLETSTVRRLGPSWAVAPQKKKNVTHSNAWLYVEPLSTGSFWRKSTAYGGI